MKRPFHLKHLYIPMLSVALALPAVAQTASDPVAALDNLAPDPVSDVVATPDVEGIDISWFQSPSDGQRPAPTGDVTSGGTFVQVNDVAGYNVYRSENGGAFVLAGTTAPGTTEFLDIGAVSGATLAYQVTAIDAAGNESDAVASATVSLGPPPSLVVSPSNNVDFGSIVSDESVAHVITISNDATLANANLSLTASIEPATIGVSAAGFSVEPASLLLAPGASDILTVTFSAADAGGFNGDYAATLTLRTNDPDLVDREVAIRFSASITGGTAVPEIQLSASSFSFGKRKLNATGTRVLRIDNLGGLPLEGSLSISGTSAFSLSDASFAVAAGSSQDITVSFAPTIEGVFGGTLTVNSNDLDESQIDIPLSGTGVTQLSGPGTQVRKVVKATLRVTDTVDPDDQVAVDAFLAQLRTLLADLLGINPNRIRVTGIAQGSTIISFQIVDAGAGSSEPSSDAALAELAAAVADTTSDEFADLGGTESFVDETADVVLAPVDADGEPILGWFTFGTSDTSVGFDDFFLFADNFGTVEGDETFDPIFDIAPADEPNGAVDFDDFFRFADDFGKPVANADEIIALLP